MCGRYYIAEEDTAEDLSKIIAELNRRNHAAEGIKTSGEIFPTDTVPVLANNRAMEPAVFAMSWGYILQGGKPVINARSETAASKAMFKDGMAQHRCLIPASNYFEWEKRGSSKIKYALRPAGHHILYMAGIYRIVEGRPEFSILTREPAESIAFIHNRMPVILPKAATQDWLCIRNDATEVLQAATTNVEYQTA